MGRPHLAVDLGANRDPAGTIRAWLARARPRVLNVAGPRASQARGLAAQARAALKAALR
jgi:hypothetical protein